MTSKLREAVQRVLNVVRDFHYVDATLGAAIHELRAAVLAEGSGAIPTGAGRVESAGVQGEVMKGEA